MIPAQLLLWVVFSFHMDPFTDLRAWAFGKSPWETRHSTRRSDPSPRLSLVAQLLFPTSSVVHCCCCCTQRLILLNPKRPLFFSLSCAAGEDGWRSDLISAQATQRWSSVSRPLWAPSPSGVGSCEVWEVLRWVFFLSVPVFNMISETGDASHELDPLSRTGLEPQPPLSDFTPVDQKHEWTGWLLR